MGATVDWDGATQTATATKDDTVVVLTIGDTSPTIDGEVVTIDQAGVIVDGRTLAPLRFVAEIFGGTVVWDGDSLTATITK
jgi:N-acetylmuramoyl-L-alanine amidase